MRNIEPPAKSKMATRGPQNGRRGLERGPTQVLGRSKQLLLNKFFDQRIPSMRNLDDREPQKRNNSLLDRN